ncbi:MAG: S9 family peptidase [Phenylobacterium sp.]|uniref:S9 family peptidase n=1 Tax=Phenylobacterium sp. TaxID=1871053 RepID=UPI0025CEFBA7|nr:S9 family peptidase [Phenylobacterium sp.]MCA3737119.1 S9 family peptidase [Phenylobacterium sp.]
MNRRNWLAGAAALAFATPAAAAARSTRPMTPPAPPVARRDPVVITQLGRTRTDEFAWMKDPDWQKVLRDPSVLKPEIRQYLEAENAYMRAVLAPTEPLQETLFQEMKGRIREDDASAPEPDGPFAYATRYATGAQHPLHVRRPRAGGAEEILLDEEAEAKGKAFYSVGAAGHSPDHRLYAWAADEQGSEVFRIRIRDLSTGQVLPSPVESSTGDFTFSPDSAWLFWTWRDDNGRPARIYRRPVRGTAADDVLVYTERDEGFFIGVRRSASGRFLLIPCGNQETSEVLLIPADRPTAAPVPLEPRRDGVLYDVEHWNDRFIIRTNADGAVDFKLVAAPEAAPGRAGWKDLIPHRPGVLVEGVIAFRRWMVRLEKADALNRIVIRGEDGAEHAIAFDEPAFALALDPGLEYDTDTLRFVYNSMTTPRSWVDYDMARRARTVVKTQDIPSGHDPSRYETRRLNARAADGTEVPVFVLMRKGQKLDGSAPLLLYGYGSYGISQEASFSIRALSLVDRGWIWARACVRGGSEKGWGWFLDGRRERKMNTFTDFVACAEHLHRQGYGRPQNTVAYGGSAGGLLMGAVANLRPDLFTGIIAAVPFVDALNTMSDASLPLTPPEWPEWGNPLTDPKAYDTIAAYSPYDNIAARPYPAVLATGGLSDPRVTYWEPAKWVARLRPASTSGRPILLKMNMEAGHAGAAGRFDDLKETALEYAFALWAVENRGAS